MVKIYMPNENVKLSHGGWNFPIDEFGYLLAEHQGESFVFNPDDGRFYECEEEADEEK